jgi:hypothetical protein
VRTRLTILPGYPRISTIRCYPIILTPEDAERRAISRSHSSPVSKYTRIRLNAPAKAPESMKLTEVSELYPTPATNTGARLRPKYTATSGCQSWAGLDKRSGPVHLFYSPAKFLPRPAATLNEHCSMNGIARNASASTSYVGAATTLPRGAKSSPGWNKP